MKEIVFAGFGGQGVLTAGLVLSQVALFSGKKATWMPSYGPAMRGGTANCTVKYSDSRIYSPGQEEPDVIMALNIPSFNKFISMVKPGGIMLIDSDIVTCDTNVRSDVKVVKIPGTTIANELNNPKALNIIMLGAMVKLMGDFSEKEAIDGMNDMFGKKGKNKYEAANTAAFKKGYAAV
ncbi:MAG: keto:oxoacid ferredoxin oxidoreductase [Eubacteriaceae bacterium]|nr:keto:oxoacid ferredoxin oxidoreductase [Eubacteriaceae bacterium]